MLPVNDPCGVLVEFIDMDQEKTSLWSADLEKNTAEFTGDLGTGRSTQTVGAHFLSPESSLAEAMFF